MFLWGWFFLDVLIVCGVSEVIVGGGEVFVLMNDWLNVI